jgi:hypothetical protein
VAELLGKTLKQLVDQVVAVEEVEHHQFPQGLGALEV